MGNYNYFLNIKNFVRPKLDPTIINGGVINSLNTNAKLGKGMVDFRSR